MGEVTTESAPDAEPHATHGRALSLHVPCRTSIARAWERDRFVEQIDSGGWEGERVMDRDLLIFADPLEESVAANNSPRMVVVSGSASSSLGACTPLKEEKDLPDIRASWLRQTGAWCLDYCQKGRNIMVGPLCSLAAGGRDSRRLNGVPLATSVSA